MPTMPLPALLVFLALLLCDGTLGAQSIDYPAYAETFTQRSAMYDGWLRRSGLGELLTVAEERITSQGVTINLGFPFTDPHRCKAAWDTLKATFEATSGLTLEQELFYKARSIMDIPPEALLVQVFNSYDPLVTPLFSVHIYSEAGRVEVEQSVPRAITKRFTIVPPRLHPREESGTADFPTDYDRDQIFDCILDYARTRYEQKNCKNREPTVTVINQIDLLEFKVTDLCMEVVQDGNPRLCAYLDRWGFDCNWAEREMYVFRIVYDELEEGFRLTLEIDGKVGSGWYDQVNIDGYLSIEDDFGEAFAEYAKIITNEIHQQLTQYCLR